MIGLSRAALAVTAMLWTCGASAESYFGATAGVMDVDIPGDNPVNAGLRGGYRWQSRWGVEGEATTSVSDGKATSGWSDADYTLSTVALYGTFRSPGHTYFKARLGYLHESVDLDYADRSDGGLSGGIGLGMEPGGNVNLELEYTLVETDVNFFSAALTFRF